MHDIIARFALDTLLVLLGYSVHFAWKDLLLERKRLRVLAMLEEVPTTWARSARASSSCQARPG